MGQQAVPSVLCRPCHWCFCPRLPLCWVPGLTQTARGGPAPLLLSWPSALCLSLLSLAFRLGLLPFAVRFPYLSPVFPPQHGDGNMGVHLH